jgi:hypothetical protein
MSHAAKGMIRKGVKSAIYIRKYLVLLKKDFKDEN